MTPQMQQSVKLLQMSSLDLADYVAARVAENPLLEFVPRAASPGVSRRAPDTPPNVIRDAQSPPRNGRDRRCGTAADPCRPQPLWQARAGTEAGNGKAGRLARAYAPAGSAALSITPLRMMKLP